MFRFDTYSLISSGVLSARPKMTTYWALPETTTTTVEYFKYKRTLYFPFLKKVRCITFFAMRLVLEKKVGLALKIFAVCIFKHLSWWFFPWRLYHLHDQSAFCTYRFFNKDGSVVFHGLNIFSFCWSYSVQNTLDPYKLWMIDTRFFVYRRIKLFVAFSPPLPSQQFGSRVDLPVQCPCEPNDIPLPFAVLRKTCHLKRRRVAEAESCGSSCLPHQPSCTRDSRLWKATSAGICAALQGTHRLPDDKLFWDNTVNLSGLCVIHCRWPSWW